MKANPNFSPRFLAATAHVDDAAVKPLPNSRKVYVGPLCVPMREVSQADTPSMFGGEPNPPIYVYDCSGPYTDPAAKIDIRSGLPALRDPWIFRRADVEVLNGPSSSYGKERLDDPRLAELRFNPKRDLIYCTHGCQRRDYLRADHRYQLCSHGLSKPYKRS